MSRYSEDSNSEKKKITKWFLAHVCQRPFRVSMYTANSVGDQKLWEIMLAGKWGDFI